MLSIRTIFISLVVAIVTYQATWYLRASSFVPIEQGDAIVVTGAHTGIGKHAALTLAKEGFTVFCGVRKMEHGEELLQSATKFEIDASKIKPLLLDVTKPEQVEAAVKEVRSIVGDEHGLYGLFNNAGVLNTVYDDEGRSIEHIPMNTVRHVFEVNYFGLLQVTKAFLPLIRRRKGRIISNTSLSGRFASPFMSAYSSSKFAVESLMDSLRREVWDFGVSVSVLQPGYIRTPIFHTLKQLITFRGVGVYATHEVASVRQFGKGAVDECPSPRVTSQAVVHAMRSPTPQTRYTVGGMSGIVQFFSWLPDAWADALLMAGRDSAPTISDQEILHLMETVQEEFEL